MSVRIVKLGSARHPGEGLRIGTVRRPPRGVPRSEFASGNWYDVWFPNLAPSAETVKLSAVVPVASGADHAAAALGAVQGCSRQPSRPARLAL